MTTTLEYQSDSEERTVQLGSLLARALNAGDVVCIEGELGAGKTRLVRGIAIGLGMDPSCVSSPTYVIVNEYLHPAGGLALTHMDAYRLTEDEADDLETLLGWRSVDAERAIAAIEWASRIGHLLPEGAVRVSIQHAGPSVRTISIEARPAVAERIRELVAGAGVDEQSA